ncbi:spore germination protein [Virgibacillus oceani]|uniref:Spore germination protein n=1 Tax=Virgibacillus oceani TaxID=1479511 RepID=A0A917HRE8_9BACI|nr:spore germination protein [Virgibacillus oceani]GGG87059.1 spore germination protein [Virgibacillus oceani]
MKKKLTEKKIQREFEKLFNDLKNSDDFIDYQIDHGTDKLSIGYFNSAIDNKKIEAFVLPYVQEFNYTDLEELDNIIPIANSFLTNDVSKIRRNLLEGFLFIHMEQSEQKYLLIPVPLMKTRQITSPEVEFSVVGPKEAFVESIDTNLNLVRKRLNIPELTIKKMKVGTITKTKVAVVSIKGIADKNNVDTVVQRIQDMDMDQVIDSSYIQQKIADNINSPFPQLLDTERPDRIAAILAEGKVAIFVDNSPHVLIGPTTLVEFFSAFEDYFLNWTIASAFRLIRVFAVFFSILVTPLYVAILTHHFEIIPKELLGTLVSSRSQVPFPPILEAIILELTIELLREAGARLPTKVGQTIGIVGGIVIGTASVEAGLTSNVLLILVALAALGSFTTPVYQMGNTIRLIRFPMLLFAHVYGLLGVSICIAYIMVHLLKLTSLGRPFFEPVFPYRPKDLKDAFIRLPFNLQDKRPFAVRSEKVLRETSNGKNDTS